MIGRWIDRWIDISGFIVQSVTGIYRLIIINVCRTKVGDIEEYTVAGIHILIVIKINRIKEALEISRNIQIQVYNDSL